MVTAAMKLKNSCSWKKKDSILKSRDITLPTKFRLVKPMVFPVVMYGCESWMKSKPGLRPAQPFRCSLFQKSHVVISGGVKIAPHTSPLRVFVMALASGSVPWLLEQPANRIHIRN